MGEKRKVEIFSAGCPVCQETIDLVNHLACPSCEIIIYDMHDKEVVTKANNLNIRSVPAVAVNGALVECCQNRGVDEAALKSAGIGQPIP